jgi:ATP-dependent 26S proteasome regulatory subunit
MPEPLERLKVLINSSTPIVIIETMEEARAVRLIRTAADDAQLPVFEWNVADGLTRAGGVPVNSAPITSPVPRSPAHHEGTVYGGPVYGESPEEKRLVSSVMSGLTRDESSIYNTKEPAQVLAHLESMSIEAVFVLKDFHRHLDDAVVVRRLRDVACGFEGKRRTLIITAPALSLPPELSTLVEYLDLPLPDVKQLHAVVEKTFACISRSLKNKLDAAGMDAVARNLRGLTEEEAERAVAQAIIARYSLSPEVIADVAEAKKDLLRRSGMLEFIDPTETMANVGGLEILKNWLEQRRGSWEDSARKFGLEPPRGVLLLGVQGCGKSMCARAIAGTWGIPLVKFDSAAIFDKYMGETEKHVKRLFQVAEELAPAVLWIDELEKIFAGGRPESASADAGVSARLMGAFLSWLQERRAPVFVAATSNDVTALPPELIRKGRFDEMFFVDLPNTAERRAILKLQLSQRKQDVAQFDLEQLASAAQGYSGAEIGAAVQTAMFDCFAGKKPVTTEAILQALRWSVPLSTSRAEDVQALRNWARTRAIPASLADAKMATKPSS